uniref:Putative sugar efflux transporter for intercellular exchange n=1 Tax=Ixodes ricinus TaxID=34613 RepID=A0A090XAZ7_IXORI
MHRQGSSRGVPFLPLVFGCLCTFVWLLYGYATNNGTVVFVNKVGTALQLVNVAVHRAYGEIGQDSLVFWAALVFVVAAGAGWKHVSAAHRGDAGVGGHRVLPSVAAAGNSEGVAGQGRIFAALQHHRVVVRGVGYCLGSLRGYCCGIVNLYAVQPFRGCRHGV